MNTVSNATLTDFPESDLHLLPASRQDRESPDRRILDAMIGRIGLDLASEAAAGRGLKISFIDGDTGDVQYRGYPVQKLAEHCDFLDVTYLLQRRELPDTEQKLGFELALCKHAPVHEQMIKLHEGFRRDADPTAVMVGMVGALPAFQHDAARFSLAERRRVASDQIVAKMPVIVAMAHRYSIGMPFMRPRADLGYTANFLYMMFGTPCEQYRPNPVLVRALDGVLMMHADRGMDASSLTLRMAGSSGANLFACISAATACLADPDCDGAATCLSMFEQLGDVSRVSGFVARARGIGGGAMLPGFGHPVCPDFDPRVAPLRKLCMEVLEELGLGNEGLFELALTAERIALEDPYFLARKLFPNLDFYSAIILKALGIPLSMFPGILALGRTAGWVAQWDEALRLRDCDVDQLLCST